MSVLFKVNVSSGEIERLNYPASLVVPKESGILAEESKQFLCMEDEKGKKIPVQVIDAGDSYELFWFVKDLPAGSDMEYTLFLSENPLPGQGVEFVDEEGKVDVKIGEAYFTSYVYDPAIAKPYLGPVITPYGSYYTRLDLTTTEHVHQRSVWVGIGDVNGIDFWNEPPGIHGKQRHKRSVEKEDGLVIGRLVCDLVWTDFSGKPVIDEMRTITFYNMPADARFMDIEIAFKANYGNVKFGPTKEAGPLGIRVAESMTVAKGGTMVNSNGAEGEAECWGRRANWCDYHGIVDGNRVGIAVFDSPDNQDYPTHWHIRNYGLMAPNNFHFLGGKALQSGDELTYKYRIYFHDGDTAYAQVEQYYEEYLNPVAVELIVL